MRVSARGLVPLLFFYLARSRRSGRFRSGQVGSGDGSVAEVGAEVCGTRERLCSSRLGPCLFSYYLACHHVIGQSVARSLGQARSDRLHHGGLMSVGGVGFDRDVQVRAEVECCM